MSITYDGHALFAGNKDAGTCAPFNSTGFDTIIVVVSITVASAFTSVTDNKGNTYTQRVTESSSGGSAAVRLYDCIGATVGTGHTVTCTGSNSYTCFDVLLATGVNSFGSVTSHGVGSSTSIKPGSITPSANGALLIIGALFRSTTSLSASVDNSYTIVSQQGLVSSQSSGILSAYLLQGTAGAVDPTISAYSDTTGVDAFQAYYLPAGGSSIELDVGSASFAVTGKTVGLQIQRQLNIGTAYFTLTGENVNLLHSRNLNITSVAFALTGKTVGLQIQRALNINNASFILTPKNVDLQAGGLLLSIGNANYTLTGKTVGLVITRQLNIGTAHFTITAQNVDLNTSTADTYEDYMDGSLGYVFGSQMDLSSGIIIPELTKYLPVTIGLNSFIEVGLIHMQASEYDDELAMITNMMLGVDLSPYDFEDYTTETNFGQDIIEDWNTFTGFEDYGVLYLTDVTYDVTVNGYVDDGVTIFNTEVPELFKLNPNSQFFVCTVNGMYHSVKLSATEIGQTFHLKLLDTSGIYTGRL